MGRFGAAVCVLAAALAGPPALADGSDKAEGAIWKFSMKRDGSRDGETRTGGFRVNGLDLFQPTKPLPPGAELKQQVEHERVGKKNPKAPRGKTILNFEKLRTRTGDTVHEPMKGQALLQIDEFGKWHGRFIDSDGRHWEFKAERIQE